MTLDDVIFIDSLPKVDLHGLDRDSARVMINDFIKDMTKQKIPVFIIVHGNGTGILKETTINVLKTNKNVIEFKGYYFNTGCTLVRIRVD